MGATSSWPARRRPGQRVDGAALDLAQVPDDRLGAPNLAPMTGHHPGHSFRAAHSAAGGPASGTRH